ncbi:hypothetical protein [Leeuwenhoekiella sp. W20_SRS_FM14]|uniref:hypothetical protein n=1 Tax=Leeuwenhoekiella sp. W20_SRS_FM14 TaxID=3240270 RepID=UPI003F97EF7D
MKKLVMTVAAATTMLFAAQNMTAQETTKDVAMNETEAQAPVADGYEKIEVSELPVTVTDAIEADKAGAEVTEAWVDAEKKTFKLILVAEGAEAETAYINAAGEWVEPKE